MFAIQTLRRALVGAVLSLLVSGSPDADASARPGDEVAAPAYSFTYRAYLGGFRLGSAATRFAVGPDRFRLEAHLRTEGLVKRLFPWTQDVSSHGALNSAGMDGVAVTRHQSKRVSRRGARDITLFYRDDGSVRVESPQDEDADERVPVELRRDTVDPLSAIFLVSHALEMGETCDRRVEVFDGRRRYDLVLKQEGSDRLELTPFAPAAGEAVRCRFHFEPIAGFGDEKNNPGIGPNNPGLVWFRRVSPDAPPVAVRIQAHNSYGPMLLHLVDASPAGEPSR